MSIFKGSGVAIVTPFNQDGSINFEAYEGLVEFQIENGTDAIIVCGTTGESATLSTEEQISLVKFTVEKVNKRVPVIAGAGSNNTSHAVELAKGAYEVGADALLAVTPYYNKATQKGLILHFTAIAESTPLPVILYSVASRTATNIEPQTCVELAKVPNIVAIKEASSNISQITEIASLVGDKMDIYSGNDDQIVPILSLGGIGVISVLANIAPKDTHDIVAKYFEGDLKGSLKLQLDAMELIKALFCEVNPIPVKEALNIMGLNGGAYRSPMCPMEDKNRERLIRTMKDYGLI
ncbi:4-hydroxy-tetrahydrodipicolinate synthase [Anaeropeptidivorans aminofermentans]|jgi:4-hydroxy-tetrahydrodipicolinate synthase|uniref:4-hydroxy-tetrahydrodipicolinate synthase n=1 Tax=Anaeropeptidivorans aminofermentans TaxID=2934315 RepID=UPI002024C63C|nr:4-hydroxy-tetrahydrodipicolinate synthase [Anaeropeptidivorans aminofermentans]MBE6012663.1 4-hydroxy-tetrahydrodipicolinate synthase [Lachnospiraceae bacterium]